jgi:hypothetical protein
MDARKSITSRIERFVPPILRSNARACRALEREIATIVEIVRSHESNGLQRGHESFKLLRDRAVELCIRFANEYGSTLPQLFAQYPALYVIEGCAMPRDPIAPRVGIESYVHHVGSLVKNWTMRIVIGGPIVAAVMYAAFRHLCHLFGV